MNITSGDTALVLTDPQNDFLSPDGVIDMPVFVSPHYYFPHDHT